VVDVQAVERERMPWREPRQDVEQDDGVDPAREGERQPRAARDVTCELDADPLVEVT
jgi:hypothetical protein